MSQSIIHIARKTLPRIALLICFGFLFQWVYKTTFWRSDLKLHAKMLDELLVIQDTCDILYFAESSNFTNHPDDSLPYSISEFIAEGMPDKRVGTINHGAYHAGLFKNLIAQIDTTSPVKTVIVTMNVRTFNQDVIFGDDEANLQMSNRFYIPAPPLLNRLFVSLNYYDDCSAHERDILLWNAWTYDTIKSDVDTIVFIPNTIRRWCEVDKFLDSNGVPNNHLRFLADQNIKAYAFKITEENPMIHSFDAICSIANQKGFDLVFNLMAENVEQADSVVGSNLIYLMRKNRDFLVDRYTNKGVLVVDNLETIGNTHFLDRERFPTEHYDMYGRQKIARNVLNFMR